MPAAAQAPREPQWRAFNRADPRLLPSRRVRQWLVRDGSLTAALDQLAAGTLQVRLVRQSLAAIRVSEARALGLAFPSRALIREVVLSGNGEDWIFARSVIPLSQLTGDLRRLRQQGQTPLGIFLFRHRQLARTPFALAAINSAHHYLPATLIGAARLLARRSVFSVDGQQLLVSEVYLPALINRIDALPSSLTDK